MAAAIAVAAAAGSVAAVVDEWSEGIDDVVGRSGQFVMSSTHAIINT